MTSTSIVKNFYSVLFGLVVAEAGTSRVPLTAELSLSMVVQPIISQRQVLPSSNDNDRLPDIIQAIKNVRWEDYHIEYEPSEGGKTHNRFAYLGNGFTKREQMKGTIGDVQTLTFDKYWNLFNLPDIHDSEHGGTPGYKCPPKLIDTPAPTS